jgi:alpha-tubulin suppressor-like RCC1 family protein
VVRGRLAAGVLAVVVAALPSAPAAAADAGWPPGVSADAFHIATVGPASITAGKNHSCAISSLGTLYCWGDNSAGQLGNGRMPADSAVASPVAHADGVLDEQHPAVQVDAGAEHTCAIDLNGTAYCWGSNTDGQLGVGSNTDQATPAAVGSLSDRTLVEITTGANHSCAIDDAGAAWCWGDNSAGQLGVPGLSPGTTSPVRVSTASGMTGPVVDIAAGGNTTCAVTDAGAAYCWGEGSAGQIGDGAGVDRDQPTRVSTGGALSGARVRQITVGDTQACGVDADGGAYCWGDTAGGTNRTPDRVHAAGVVFGELSAGARHVCGLDRNSSAAYCWGSDVNGQLGDGSTTHADDPVRVDTGAQSPGATLLDIAGGARHTCALDSRGVSFCWGADDDGQLGTGAAGASIVPAAVAGLPRPPAAVTGVRVAPLDGGLRVTWRPPSTFGTGAFVAYLVQTTSGDQHCAATTAAATGCDVTGLVNGTGYDVAVLTITAAGQTLSDVVTGIPAAAPRPSSPGAPPTLAPGDSAGLPVTGESPVVLAAAGFLMIGLGLAALLVRQSR